MGERILSDLPVMKFSKVGEVVKGKLISVTPSKKFKESWVLTMDNEGNRFIIFVSNIVYEKLKQNAIELGSILKLTYNGKKDTKTGDREYNDITIAILD